MIDKIKEILEANETEINQSEFTHWGILNDKYDDVAEQIGNLFSIQNVSCSDIGCEYEDRGSYLWCEKHGMAHKKRHCN